MENFLDQFYQLISSQAGTLLYQFILAFSIAGSLVGALSHLKRSDTRQVRRVVLGLSLLLLFRLIVFIAAGMAWGDFLIRESMLPVIARSLDLLSLVVITWLWAIPDPARAWDAVFILIFLTIATLAVFGLLAWVDYSQLAGFNGSLPDRISQLTALILVIFGLLLLVFRRPNGWSIGFLMLSVIGAGHLVQLIFPPRTGDIAYPVWIAQIIAYPLLFLIPTRFSEPQPVLDSGDIPGAGTSIAKGEAGWDLLARPWSVEYLALLAASLPDEAYRQIARFASKLLQAEICLVVSWDSGMEHLQVVSGYDRMSGTDLAGFTLYPQQFPLLVDAMKANGVTRLPASSAAPDISNLCEIYRMERVGVILASSQITSQPDRLLGIVLFSPKSEQNWTTEDQDRLAGITPPLAHFLHRIKSLAAGQSDLVQARQELMLYRERERDFLVEHQNIRDLLDQVEEDLAAEQAAIDLLAGLRYSKGEVQQAVTRLQSDHRDLTRMIRLAKELPPTGELIDLAGKLDQANQEILFLRAALKGAQDNILLARAVTLPVAENELDKTAIKTMIQEIRQTTSMIQEYSSYLLGGSLGDVSQVQYKTLLRIQDTADRLESLSLRLASALAEGLPPPLPVLPVLDVSELTRNAIQAVDLELREKQLKISMDLAQDLPPVYAHPGQFQSLVTALLRAGIDIASTGGELLLWINPFSDEQHPRAIEYQLTCGQGGPEQPLPEFLQEDADFPAAEIKPPSDKLSLLQELAVNAGGRVWLSSVDDSDPLITLVIPSGQPVNPSGYEVGNEG